MAIDGYQALALSPCVDNAGLQDAFDSLGALVGEMGNGTVDVTCDPIDIRLEGSDSDGESCITIFESEPIISTGAGNEKCLFLVNIGFAPKISGSFDGALDIAVEYSLKCDGKIVATTQGDADEFGVGYFAIDCPVGSKIELCAESSYTQTGLGQDDGGGGFVIDWTLRMCGGRACITERDISRPGAHIPCEIKADCRYGMDALALIAQNLNALCSAFQFGGKSIRCETVVANDNEDVAVALNLQSDAVFIAFGTVEVCTTGGGNDSVLVTPSIGCSDNPASCLSRRVYGTGDQNFAWFRDKCTVIPVATCGNCKAGEDIYVGQNPKVQCNAKPASQSEDFGYSIRSEYCVWIFEDVANDIAAVEYPPRCITTNYLDRLSDKGEEIHEAVCRRIIPRCTIRCRDYLEFDQPEGLFPPGLIQEAIPWTPPPDDPTATAAPKKWFITGSFSVCSDFPDANLEGNSWAYAGWIIYCGGAPYISPTTSEPVGNRCAWTLAGSGSYAACGGVRVVALVECPIDEPLEIVPSVSSFGGGWQGGPWTITGNYKAICF